MAKDPAFLFYSNDFLTGVLDLTMEERGQYITLLCLHHQKGRLTDKMIRMAAPGVSDDVLSKFKKDQGGLYFNERLEAEAERRRAYCESRRNNRKKKTSPSHKKHMSEHMEDEIENIGTTDESRGSGGREEQVRLPFPSVEFAEAWKKWKEYRQKTHRFKYKTASSEKAALTELSNKAEGEEDLALLIIQKAISREWKGFFKLSDEDIPKNNLNNYGEGVQRWIKNASKK